MSFVGCFKFARDYYKLADMKTALEKIDEWYRRRLRMVIWKQWKRIKTKYSN
ncbi:MAG: hypothetical protein LBB84_00555, partial [Tannerellaceae bacterium]|nr:hypothetical protein [Tannerellaceae bacterium]